MLTKVASRELAPSKITVNAVSPGFIPTSLHGDLSDSDVDEALQAIDMGRFGRPEEIAELVYFLTSKEASYITGQVIGADGGMRA